jgi:simple sugar transport system substrate-binding protein
MRRLRRSLAVPIGVAAVVLLLAACGSSSNNNSGSKSTASSAVNIASSGKPCSYKFALITHGDNGSFWSVVYKGAKNAAADLGCTLTETYGSQQQGQAEPDDNAENAQIQNAINAHVDGMAVSDHDPSLMNPTLAKAAAAGIPVVLLNAGCDNTDIAASKAITCVGQPEQLAGQAAGAQFKALGNTNVLCVIHQSGQNLLDRCNGIAQGLGVGQKCGTALVTSNPASKPKIATFDLNSGVQTDITNGSMAFAVDQQQYLQGYLPITFLYLYKKHEGQSVGGGTTVASGPLIVTKSNISKVSSAISAGDD